MGTIEEIVTVIDEKLLESGKQYLLLGEVNKLLLEKEIISVSEHSDKALKKLLEQNAIPHAHQTNNSPKQWRIPLSNKGLKKRKSTPKKIIKPKVQTHKPKNEIPTFTSNQKIWLIAIVICVLVWLSEPFSENYSAEKIKNSPYDSSVYQVEKYLKTNYLKDPDSYQSINWSKVLKINDNEFRVRHKFRARNSFGGFVVEEKIFSLDADGNVNSTMDVE